VIRNFSFQTHNFTLSRTISQSSTTHQSPSGAMKFSTGFTAFILPFLAVGSPLSSPEPEPFPESDEANSVYCPATTANAPYSLCASVNTNRCPVRGYLALGQVATVICYTYGDVVAGDG